MIFKNRLFSLKKKRWSEWEASVTSWHLIWEGKFFSVFPSLSCQEVLWGKIDRGCLQFHQFIFFSLFFKKKGNYCNSKAGHAEMGLSKCSYFAYSEPKQ